MDVARARVRATPRRDPRRRFLFAVAGEDAVRQVHTRLRVLGGSIPATLAFPTLLLTCELVANAVEHGCRSHLEQVLVRLVLSDDRVQVDVADPGQGFTPPGGSVGSSLPERGWGLALVTGFADRWGVEVDELTHVWFELDGEPPPTA